ncbi:MAG: ABC transporter permease [bacterium]
MKKFDIIIRFGLLVFISFLIFILNNNFARLTNLINILRQTSLLFVLGIGMTLVILTGGIDLSNGAVLALSSCIGAMVLKSNLPIVFGVLTALCIGIICGMSNGAMVSYLKIPPFIVTFAMMFIARGVVYIILRGRPIFGFGPGFRFIGAGYLFEIPVPIIFSMLFLLIFYTLLEFTAFGVNIFAIGSNVESARLVGINVKKVTVLVYMLSGLMSAFAGLLYTARLNTASPMIGTSFPLDAIAIVIIGGASLGGGEGNLIGTAIGALTITVIMNGMNLMSVSPLWQRFTVGGLILIMITIKTLTENLKLKRKTLGLSS